MKCIERVFEVKVPHVFSSHIYLIFNQKSSDFAERRTLTLSVSSDWYATITRACLPVAINPCTGKLLIPSDARKETEDTQHMMASSRVCFAVLFQSLYWKTINGSSASYGPVFDDVWEGNTGLVRAFDRRHYDYPQ